MAMGDGPKARHWSSKWPSTVVPTHGKSSFGRPMREDAPAANHADKSKRKLNPTRQHQSVALVSAGDDETEDGFRRQRFLEQRWPGADAKARLFGEEPAIGQRGSVVKHCDLEIQPERQRRDGLSDMPRTSDPEGARRRDGFLIEPLPHRLALGPGDREIP